MHLYAVDHWIDHLLALSELIGSQHVDCELNVLCRDLERLTEMHNELATLNGWNLRDELDPSLSPRGDIWHSLHISPTVKKLLDASLTCRNGTFVNDSQTAKSRSKSPMPRCLTLLDTEQVHSGLRTPSSFDAVLHDSNPL